MTTPKTLQDAIVYFADFEHCKQFLMDLRWPDGKVACPACGSERVVWLASVKRWKCYEKHSSPQFSLKTGTIFEDSPLGLDKWLAALWLLVNCKNGISSCEIARDLGITQKSAWFMAHRLRFALHFGSFDRLSGEIEADETYVGGKARNMSKARREKKGISQKRSMAGKVAVMGLLDRHGKDGTSRIRTMVIDGRRKTQLCEPIETHVMAGSTVYTDALRSYNDIQGDYTHKVIDHAEKYVDGNVHTNGLENYWSLLKRALKGTYVSVEPFHLFRYLDEQAFRFNNRTGANDFDRFNMAAAMIVGRRLTWKQLVGKLPDGVVCAN
jgi:transposase-like protein